MCLKFIRITKLHVIMVDNIYRNAAADMRGSSKYTRFHIYIYVLLRWDIHNAGWTGNFSVNYRANLAI